MDTPQDNLALRFEDTPEYQRLFHDYNYKFWDLLIDYERDKQRVSEELDRDLARLKMQFVEKATTDGND